MQAPEPSAPSPLRHNRPYMILWSGQAISHLGDGIQGIAFPLLVLYLTHSALSAGVAGALFSLPYLILGLPAGVLVDRWNRKRVMMTCDTIRTINAVSVPLTAALGHLTIMQLYMNTLVEGSCFAFFSLAALASLPRVVPKEQLMAATARNQASMSTIGLIAPPLGGFIFQTLGQTIPFVLNAVSYAVSVISLRLIRLDFQMERKAPELSFRADLKEGTVWLWNEPVLRLTTLITAGINLSAAPLGLILIVRARDLHASAILIGVMLAIGSIGGTVGSLLAPRLQKQLRFERVIVASTWYQALIVVLIAFAPNPILLGCLMALLGVAGPVYNAVTMGYRLAATPDDLQGRVNSAARVVAFAPIPISSLLAGFLLVTIGAVPAIFACAATRLAVALLATSFAASRGGSRDESSPRLSEPAIAVDREVFEMAQRLKQCTEQERTILCLRFALDGEGFRSLAEVASAQRLSQNEVRELEIRALGKLTGASAVWAPRTCPTPPQSQNSSPGKPAY